MSIRPGPIKQFSGSEYYTDMVLPILNMVNKMTRVSHSSINLGMVSIRPGPKVIKPFFMLNSAEHNIYPAHKC